MTDAKQQAEELAKELQPLSVPPEIGGSAGCVPQYSPLPEGCPNECRSWVCHA